MGGGRERIWTPSFCPNILEGMKGEEGTEPRASGDRDNWAQSMSHEMGQAEALQDSPPVCGGKDTVVGMASCFRKNKRISVCGDKEGYTPRTGL